MLPRILRTWNDLLAYLNVGGDPSLTDWAGFRPLSVGREEDWSDWLQHFLATSASGQFAFQLFGCEGLGGPGDCRRPVVIREDSVEDRRADLVIQWSSAVHTHVEVKAGDRNLAKTVETAANLEVKYPAARWTHFLLLPAEDLDLWRAGAGTCKDRGPSGGGDRAVQ